MTVTVLTDAPTAAAIAVRIGGWESGGDTRSKSCQNRRAEYRLPVVVQCMYEAETAK
jgi:hypothetical protein